MKEMADGKSKIHQNRTLKGRGYLNGCICDLWTSYKSEKETTCLENTEKELPNYSFLAEDPLEQGYEVMPFNDSGYSPVLKENLKEECAPPLLYIKGNKKILEEISMLNKKPVRFQLGDSDKQIKLMKIS